MPILQCICKWSGAFYKLVRVLGDSEMIAYMHYVLVHHIASTMVQMVLDKYKDFFYIEVMPEKSKNAAFYEQFGFTVMEDGVAMQRCNRGK